jgi:MFS family permease
MGNSTAVTIHPVTHFDSRKAWRVAAGAAVASGTSFGTAYTFGPFSEAMAEDFGSGRGPTALVFGITLLLFFGLGVVSGPISDRVGARRLVVGGGILIAGGLALTSQVGSIYLGYVTIGVGVGVGGGLIATPMYATAGGWFARHRAIAMGLVASGNGLGTLLLVPFAERLIDSNGWRSAYLRLALVDLVLFAFAAATIARPPVAAAPPPAISHMRAVARVDAFKIMFATGLLFSMSLFVAFAFVVDFATDEGISSSRAALLIGIIGATSIIGRLGITSLSGRFSSVRLLQGCLAAQPVAFLLWAVSSGSYPVLVAFAVTMGIAYGGFVALGPEVAAVLFGVVGLGGTMGLMFMGAGLGGLLGPTTAGFLSDLSDGQMVPILFALGASLLTVVLSLRLPTQQVFTADEIAG